MTLDQFIDTIIDISEELKNEVIDYDKMNILSALLNKLIEKYRVKVKNVSYGELDNARFYLTFEMGILKSDKTKDVLLTLYEITVAAMEEKELPVMEESSVNLEKVAIL